MTRLEGIRLILAVRDLRTATDFYMNVLGFSRDFGDESDGWSWLSRDGFRVGLGHCADATPASELGDHSYVAYVTVDDIGSGGLSVNDVGGSLQVRSVGSGSVHQRGVRGQVSIPRD